MDTNYTDPGHEQDLIEWEYETRDRAPEGDARRCPRHPHIATSSADGLFDAPCGACEFAMEDDAQDARHERDRRDDADDMPHGVIYPPLDGEDAADFEDDRRGAAFLHADDDDDIPF
jgi:hypothetical protein